MSTRNILETNKEFSIETKSENCYTISIPKLRRGWTDMRKDIRTKIVDTLNERQLNRKNLAEYTGISQSTITKILGRFIENPSKDTLIAMNKYNGRLIWEKELYSQTQKRVSWHMPVPINNQIVATSGEGDVIVFDMLTGEETKKLKMEKLFVAPTAYNNGLLFYTDDADLIMYR